MSGPVAGLTAATAVSEVSGPTTRRLDQAPIYTVKRTVKRASVGYDSVLPRSFSVKSRRRMDAIARQSTLYNRVDLHSQARCRRFEPDHPLPGFGTKEGPSGPSFVV